MTILKKGDEVCFIEDAEETIIALRHELLSELERLCLTCPGVEFSNRFKDGDCNDCSVKTRYNKYF